MPEFDIDSALAPEPPPQTHGVAVTFEIYATAEDVEGVEEERGWLYPPDNPIWVEPDAYDTEAGKTAVDLAVGYLRGEGATEASASHFSDGVWYLRTGDADADGMVEQNSYHLQGFTEEEAYEVFRRITGRGRLRGRLGPPRPA